MKNCIHWTQYIHALSQQSSLSLLSQCCIFQVPEQPTRPFAMSQKSSIFLTQAISICSRIYSVTSLIVDAGNLFLFFFSDQSGKCIDFIDLFKEPGFDSIAFKKVFLFLFFYQIDFHSDFNCFFFSVY